LPWHLDHSYSSCALNLVMPGPIDSNREPPGPADEGSIELETSERDRTALPDEANTTVPTANLSSDSSSNGIAGVDSPADQVIAQRFERHELLGRGGFGAVYRAYDRKLERFIALKVPHVSAADNGQVQKRVEREASATARLRHPNIVALFDAVYLHGHSLLINELIDGETLATMIARNPQGCDFRLAAAIMHRIARAVQHAHDQSVLHRDIKPSNILLDSTMADGELRFCPRLTDFGVATILREGEGVDGSRTHTETVGTWHYTPPEIIEGGNGGHTRAGDIYSLGVVLYELLTGSRPFKELSLVKLLPKVRSGDFVLPRSIRNNVPRDLEAICLRCMARNPTARYASASSLADDLSRFLAGETVFARMPHARERLIRTVRRHPTVAAIVTVSAMALIMVVAVVVKTNRQLFRLNHELQVAIDSTRQALFEYEQANYATDLTNASAAIRQSNLRDARTLLDRYNDSQPVAHHRDIEWEHNRFLISRTPTPIAKSTHALYCMAQTDTHYYVAGASGDIIELDRQTHSLMRSWPTGQIEVNSLVIDSANQLLWSSGDDGSIHAYDLATHAPRHQIQAFTVGRAYDMVHFPQQARIFCISSEGSIVVIDTVAATIHDTWEPPTHIPRSIAMVGSDRLAVGHDHGILRLFDISTSELVEEVILDPPGIVGAISADPIKPWLWLLVASTIRTLDLETMTVSEHYPTADEPVSMVQSTIDQTLVVTFGGGCFHRYRASDTAELIEVDRWTGEGQRIFSLLIDDRSGELLSVGVSGEVLKWPLPPKSRSQYPRYVDEEQAEKLRLIETFDILPGTPMGDWPVVLGNTSKKLIQLDTFNATATDLHIAGSKLCQFSTVDEHRLVLNCEDASLQVLDLRDHSLIDLPIKPGLVRNILHGKNWVGITDSGLNQVLLLHSDYFHPITQFPAFNPAMIAVANRAKQIFWNDDAVLMTQSIDSTGPAQRLEKFSRNPTFLELSNDENLLAVGLSEREVHLWDWRQNRRVGPVMMHDGPIHAVSFSPDGRTLMTVDSSATLRFWNLTTGQQVSQTHLGITPDNYVRQVRFTSDSNFVVVLHDRSIITTIRIR